MILGMGLVPGLASCNVVFGIEPGKPADGGGAGAGGDGTGGTGGTGGATGCPDGTALAWARSFGNFESQSQALVAVTQAGDTYVAGSFSGALTFGEKTLVAEAVAPYTDIFVAKLDASGQPVWSERFGNTFDQHVSAIAADDAGNLYLAGHYNGDMASVWSFGGPDIMSFESYELFVASLGPDGAHRWTRPIGAPVDDFGLALAVRDDELIVAAHYGVAFDLDGMMPTDLYSANGGNVIVSLDASSGAVDWFTGIANSGKVDVTSVALGQDVVLVAGNTEEDIVITHQNGAATQTADFVGPLRDLFAIGLTRGGGSPVWVHQMSGDGHVRAVAEGKEGQAILAGDFKGSLEGGVATLASAGDLDLFVAAVAHPSGAPAWEVSLGGAEDQSLTALTTGEGGEIALTGAFAGTFDLGCAGVLESAGGLDLSGVYAGGDLFMARLDAAGAPLWAASAGDSDFQVGQSVSSRGSHLAVAGTFLGKIDLGAGELTSAGKNDVVVARFER